MGIVNEKATMKNVMLRWKRFTRKSCLTKGELRELTDKADKLYLRLILMRLKRGARASAREDVELSGKVLDLIRKQVTLKHLDTWYVKFTVERKFKRSVVRRNFHNWRTAWVTRKAGEGFWDRALKHDDGKLMKITFKPWREFAKRQKKIMRERKAARVLLKHSSAASVFRAFSIWAKMWVDWRKETANNFKALTHYISKLSSSTFQTWAEGTARSKKIAKVMPIFLNMSNRGKFLFAWKKWKDLVLEARRHVSLKRGTDKIIANFLAKWMGKGAEKVFSAWKVFVLRRRRAARVGEIVRRKIEKTTAGRAYRTWLHAYVRGKLDLWGGNEGKFTSDKGRLDHLSQALKESGEQTEEDNKALRSLESDVARAQSELMDCKNEADRTNHELELLTENLTRAEEKLAALLAEKSKKEKELAVTRNYFEQFKRRPEWGRWTLGVDSYDAEEEERKERELEKFKELGQERARLLQDSADYARHVNNLKERKKAEKRTWRAKVDAARTVAEASEKRRDESRRDVEQVKLKIEEALREYRVAAEDLGVVEGERTALEDAFNDNLNKYDVEEKALKERLEVAERKERDAHGVLGRRRETAMGLRAELKVVKGRRLEIGRGGRGSEAVWQDQVELVGEVAEAGAKMRAKVTGEEAEAQRRRKIELVKGVVQIWEDDDEEKEGEKEDDTEGGEDTTLNSRGSRSRRSTRGGLSVRSGNVPLRGGGSRKRGGKSFATDTLIETKRMTKHAKMAEKVVRLSDNLIDEGELIDDSEKMRIVEFERSIDNLRRKIMTKLL
jgi:hypothetical protein